MSKLARIILIIFLFVIFALNNACFCADYKIDSIITDNSDRLVLIKGSGNYKTNQSSVYIPSTTSNSLNLINNITKINLNNPYRFVLDIPNATLVGASRDYKINNSKTLQNVRLSQFSLNPNVVRAVFSVNNYNDLSKFKVYTNGSDIIVKYNPEIINNSLQYKFYTPSGDMDKTATNQNLANAIINNATGDTSWQTPILQTKYHLSEIDKNQAGLILRGIGSISLQRVTYNQDNSKATAIIDNATISPRLDGKTYILPTANNKETNLTISKLNSKKIQLVLEGENLKDYRFVVSQDGQCLFVSHRTNVLNSAFSNTMSIVSSYETSKTSTGYRIFDFKFARGVTYDVFELNNNFYLDINNLSDYNTVAFEKAFKNSGTKIQAMKIAGDKTRFIIPQDNLNFSYANIESNSKSIKLCFKEKSQTIQPKKEAEVVVVDKVKPVKKEEKGNINVTYIPKGEDDKITKSKWKKEKLTISAMNKVVLDPGHGGSDCGAIALENKFYEKTINLEVAKMVKALLEKKNVHVYMTRESDITITLEDRVNFSNEINPDIYVSIHANSTLQEDSYGLETHYFKENSIDLANTIHKHFASEKNLKKWETKDRGVIKSRFYVINHTEAPSILVEMGFISNRIERDKLDNKERKEEIAEAIAKGILEYLKIK